MSTRSLLIAALGTLTGTSCRARPAETGHETATSVAQRESAAGVTRAPAATRETPPETTTLPLPARPAGGNVVRLTAADEGRTVELAAGQELEVTLASNRTTGHGWSWVDSGGALVELAGKPAHDSDSAAARRAGAGGREVWRFLARRAGRDTLRLVYGRQSERGAAPARAVSFELRIH